MTAAGVVAYALLSTGALLCLVRVARGPSLLDRVVATETLLAVLVGGLGVHAALARDRTVVPVLVVVALLGFLGAVAVSRYVGGMPAGSSGEGDGAGRPGSGSRPGGGRGDAGRR